MNSFFKSIGLYDSLTIEINIQKEELIRRLGKERSKKENMTLKEN